MGEAKYRRYLTDMAQLEMELNCKLLPDIARASKNVSTISEQEKCNDTLMTTMNQTEKSKDIFKLEKFERITNREATDAQKSSEH